MLKHSLSIIVVILSVLAGTTLRAQNTLFNYNSCPDLLSRSHNVKIYPVPADSVLSVIYKQNIPAITSPLLRTPLHIVQREKLDSVLRSPLLPAGYYLYVTIDRNNVLVNKYHKPSFQNNFIELGHSCLLEVLDMNNRYDTSATVSIGKRIIPYDHTLRAYILAGLRNTDTVTIRKGNDIMYHQAYVYKNSYGREYYQQHQVRENKYGGYMVTNKPKYLPGDTVKWKAYLLDPQTGKPVTSQLQLRMSDQIYYSQLPSLYQQRQTEREVKRKNRRQRKNEPGIQPYSYNTNYQDRYGKTYVLSDSVMPVLPGVYFSEFVVADSMDIDRLYNLMVTGPAGTRLHTQLLLQDYLLNDLRLKVKGDEYLDYQHGDSIRVFAYASTANNLPLMDGTASITLTPQYYYSKDNKKIFRDTLYHSNVPLDPSGETVFTIPTDSFPKYNAGFKCDIRVLSSNNETKDTTIYLNFRHEAYYIRSNQSGNIVSVTMIHNKKSVPGSGFYKRQGDTTAHRIQYPAQVTVGPHEHTLTFYPDSAYGDPVSHYLQTQLLNDALTADDEYINDTAYLRINNPQHAFVRFTAYKGDTYLGIFQTENDTLLKVYSKEGETVTVRASYFWKHPIAKTFVVYKYDKDIRINVDKKDVVYPGQRDTISIRLSDVDGRPVGNTNLTVLAFNNQFTEDYVPSLPYSGTLLPGVDADTIRQLNLINFNQSSGLRLSDLSWVNIAGADTTFMYRQVLLNPRSNTWIRFKLKNDAPSQMSVHIMEKSAFHLPYIIYVDHAPVFFNPVNASSSGGANAFHISPGKHTVTVRMNEYQYTIRDVNIIDHTSLALFINGDLDMPASIDKIKVANALTTEERNVLSRYYLMYRAEYQGNIVNNYDRFGYAVPDGNISQRRDYRNYMANENYCFRQYPSTYICSNSRYTPRGQINFAGPFDPGKPIIFYQFNNTKQEFAFEQNQVFTFRDGMIRVEKENAANWLPSPYSSEYWPELCYTIPKPPNLDTFIAKLKPDTLTPRFSMEQSHVPLKGKDTMTLTLWFRDYNGHGLDSAYLVLKGKDGKMIAPAADASGTAVIRYLRPGNYEAELVFRGITAKLENKITIMDSFANRVTIQINSYRAGNASSPYYKQPSEESLREVVVQYSKPLIAEDGKVNASFTSEDIKHMPTRDLTKLVATPGGIVTRGRGDVMYAGSKSGNTVTYLDGVMVRGGVPDLIENYYREPEFADQGAQEFLASGKTQEFITNFLGNQLVAAGLRNNFRDYAIWEPNLWTDKDGRTWFHVTYPDNITGWKTYVLAMNENGFSGKKLQMTNAFKPLSAQLSVPRFLRYGDTVSGIAKVSNYTRQAFDLQTGFIQDGKEMNTEKMTVNNIKVAPVTITAPTENRVEAGNVQVAYTIKADNGYMDGEQRNIPVFFTGTKETSGTFAVMSRDTSIRVSPDKSKHFTGTSYIMLDGSLIDVMLREIENLVEYPYGCTEQLTTKLLAISYEEDVKAVMGIDTLNNSHTKDSIVSQLIKKQNPNGSFGWWNENTADLRITNYVVNTLARINKERKLDLIIHQGLRFLANSLDPKAQPEYLRSLSTLSANKYDMDYNWMLSSLNDSFMSLHDSFVVATIRMEQGLPYRSLLDTLVKKANSKNGLSWGRDGYDWYRNELATTLLAYKLIEHDTIYSALKDRILQYLMHSRRNGYYRNTAESGQVLMAVLPGLIGNTSMVLKDKHTRVTVSGTMDTTITTFPEKFTSHDKDIDLTIRKTGVGPAYVSVVHDYLVADPEPKYTDFSISTFFIAGNDTLTELKAGSDVTLRATVTCDTLMDYIMIEVPIPAGCVQKAMSSYQYPEANRDNYKDKTIIYCNQLGKGTYTFDVPLEVRYKGSFKVNPTRASMMYYPAKYGNNRVKEIKVR